MLKVLLFACVGVSSNTTEYGTVDIWASREQAVRAVASALIAELNEMPGLKQPVVQLNDESVDRQIADQFRLMMAEGGFHCAADDPPRLPIVRLSHTRIGGDGIVCAELLCSESVKIARYTDAGWALGESTFRRQGAFVLLLARSDWKASRQAAWDAAMIDAMAQFRRDARNANRSRNAICDRDLKSILNEGVIARFCQTSEVSGTKRYRFYLRIMLDGAQRSSACSPSFARATGMRETRWIVLIAVALVILRLRKFLVLKK